MFFFLLVVFVQLFLIGFDVVFFFRYLLSLLRDDEDIIVSNRDLKKNKLLVKIFDLFNQIILFIIKLLIICMCMEEEEGIKLIKLNGI